MQVKIERVGDLILNVRENHGEKFYCLDDIIEQLGKMPQCALMEQAPIEINARIIFAFRYDETNFIRSVFVDETGLKNLTKINFK